MLEHNELKKGIQFILQGQPHEVLESSLTFKGRGSSVMQTKIKNLSAGNIIARTFHPGETFKEAEIKKMDLKFLYANRGEYFLCEAANPSKRFSLKEEQLGMGVKFLKPNQIVQGLFFEEKIINILMPIKINLKVTEAPPSLRAGRAEAGTKQITLETGATIQAPIFIKAGDIIEVNTETEEYARRVE